MKEHEHVQSIFGPFCVECGMDMVPHPTRVITVTCYRCGGLGTVKEHPYVWADEVENESSNRR